MIVKNKILPFKYAAMAIWPVIFIRSDKVEEVKSKYSKETYQKWISSTIRHERIHFLQQKELAFILFYILYVIVMWPLYGYKNIPFEKEAKANQTDKYYFKNRERYAWLKYF